MEYYHITTNIIMEYDHWISTIIMVYYGISLLWVMVIHTKPVCTRWTNPYIRQSSVVFFHSSGAPFVTADLSLTCGLRSWQLTPPNPCCFKNLPIQKYELLHWWSDAHRDIGIQNKGSPLKNSWFPCWSPYLDKIFRSQLHLATTRSLSSISR